MSLDTPAPRTEKPSGFAALRHREFTLFIGSKLLSYSCHHMLVLAVGYQVYDLTGDAMALAYISLVMVSPTFLFALFTGYVSDRFDRRSVLVAGYGCMALSGAVLWIISNLGLIASNWVYIALFINGTARAFVNPAMNAIIPHLVPKDDFANAMTWNMVITRMTQIGGPALGGVIYLLGPEVVYATGAICCAIGTFATLSLTPRAATASGKMPGMGELLAGAVYVFKHKIILGTVMVDLIIILSASIIAVLPIIAKDLLEVGPAGAGILRSSMAIGGLIAALAMTQIPITRHAGKIMFVGSGLLALSVIAMGFSTWFPLSIAIMAFMGMADMLNVNIRHTFMQVATPDNMRGRVSSVAMLAASGGTELGGFRAGMMAALIGIVPSIVAGGVAGLVLVGLCWKLFPEMGRVQRMDRFD